MSVHGGSSRQGPRSSAWRAHCQRTESTRRVWHRYAQSCRCSRCSPTCRKHVSCSLQLQRGGAWSGTRLLRSAAQTPAGRDAETGLFQRSLLHRKLLLARLSAGSVQAIEWFTRSAATATGVQERLGKGAETADAMGVGGFQRRVRHDRRIASQVRPPL